MGEMGHSTVSQARLLTLGAYFGFAIAERHKHIAFQQLRLS